MSKTATSWASTSMTLPAPTAKQIAFTEQVPGLTYKGAVGHVFRLSKVSEHPDYKGYMSCWDREKKRWTDFKLGTVYTYSEAVMASIYGEIPDEGRWYAIGSLIYSVE